MDVCSDSSHIAQDSTAHYAFDDELDPHGAPPARIAPGKRTLTMGLVPGAPVAPVQMKISYDAPPAAGDDPFWFTQVASEGVVAASAPLPHLAQVQRSFGRHDIGGIQAEVGGAAGSAARAIGAEAYATGNRVGFAQAPDLFTAPRRPCRPRRGRRACRPAHHHGQQGARSAQDPRPGLQPVHADCMFNSIIRLGLDGGRNVAQLRQLARDNGGRAEITTAGEWAEGRDIEGLARGLGIRIVTPIYDLGYEAHQTDRYGNAGNTHYIAHIFGGHFVPMRPAKKK